MNTNYSQFYKGTVSLPTYGSSTNQIDTLVKYQFNTTDENGNKIMDKMTKKEMSQTLKDICSMYGDNVMVEFSGDGLAALIDSKKGAADAAIKQAGQEVMKKKNETFQQEVKQYNAPYSTDKVAMPAVKNYSKEEQGGVNEFIRQNFLVENNSFAADVKQQASIIPEETIAKLESAEKADSNGNMDYRAAKDKYLGNGSRFVNATNVIDKTKTIDSNAYFEYQKVNKNINSGKNSLKYMTKWYTDAVKKNPFMADNYEKQSNEYANKNVENQKQNTIFAGRKVKKKTSFIDSLKAFQKSSPKFLSSTINRKLSNKFWLI